MPPNLKYDHEPEFMVESYLNRYLIYEGILIRRPDKNMQDNYAPDLDVWSYNFKELKYNYLICRIEVEQRISLEDDFIIKQELLLPPNRWTDWSFLGRKIDNEKFNGNDIYVLCNKKPHNKIFWATFGDIKKNCEKYNKKPKDRAELYYRIPIPKNYNQFKDIYCGFIRYGYKELAMYINFYKG